MRRRGRRVPGGHVCSASLKGIPRTSVRDVGQGAAPLRKLFSKDQRAFFAEHAPEGIGFEDLSLLGPIFVLKIKGVPEGFARKMVVELWLYPDGTRILELSTKCAPSEAFQVAAEGRAFLAERGIEVSGDAQTTKTRKALEFFSKQLSADPQRHADRERRDPDHGPQEQGVAEPEQDRPQRRGMQPGADAREEQRRGEEHDRERVVVGALDEVARALGGRGGLHLQAIGGRRGRELVLRHRERRQRGPGVLERPVATHASKAGLNSGRKRLS